VSISNSISHILGYPITITITISIMTLIIIMCTYFSYLRLLCYC